jgi:hypothetical protein
MLSSSPAWGGVYADDLAKCLVSSTTEADRVSLARWIFMAFAAHPAVAPLTKATQADIDAVNAETGRLFMRLLTESCRAKSVDALRYEGANSMQQAFTVLGQVAGMELSANPAVQVRIGGLLNSIDKKKLEELGQSLRDASGGGAKP